MFLNQAAELSELASLLRCCHLIVLLFFLAGQQVAGMLGQLHSIGAGSDPPSTALPARVQLLKLV